MSYSQAVDAQLELLSWYTQRQGAQQLAGLYENAMAERRIGSSEASAFSFQDYLNTVLVGLDGGAPVYWSPEMCGLLESVATSMPAWTLRPEALPAERGFIWFSKPLTLPYWPTAGRRDLHAIGITSLGRYAVVSFWFDEDLNRHPFPGACLSWDYGSTWVRVVGKPGEMGITVENADRHDMLGRYLAAALALMEQRIIVSRPERPSRSTRKRAAEVWEHEPIIRVIQLRRAVNPNAHREDGSEAVEWSCSWVVRGHWRQQAVGKDRAERRPVFVLPYVKGDPDKPLKAPADRVFAVVR